MRPYLSGEATVGNSKRIDVHHAPAHTALCKDREFDCLLCVRCVPRNMRVAPAASLIGETDSGDKAKALLCMLTSTGTLTSLWPTHEEQASIHYKAFNNNRL